MNDETPSINLDDKILEKYKKMEMVYLTDQEFYALYKIVSLLESGKHQDDFQFQLEAISPSRGVRSEYYRSNMFAIHNLKDFCSIFKLTIDKIYLQDDKISKGFYGSTLKELQEYLSQKPNTPSIVAEREFVDTLVKGTATSKELFKITMPMGRLIEVLDYAIFRIKKPTKKQMQNIQGFFWIYIEKFGNDQLHVADNHEIYFRALNQLFMFGKVLREHTEMHAPETIISLSEMLENDSHLPTGPLKNYSRLMPIHCLALAEKIGWIKVLQVNAGALDWMESMDMYDTEKNQSVEINGYRVKLKVLDKFMEFTDPQTIVESPKVSASSEKWWKPGSKPIYDKENRKIILDGKECEIPKTAYNKLVLCEYLFPPKRSFGEPLNEYEVIDLFYKRGKQISPRAFYDTVSDVNDLVKEKLNIVDLLKYQAEPCQVRIRKDLFP